MKKVIVGLSGGVDSAVSAALLKERGYDVVGAFIKIWQPQFLECTWREDRLDAMRVCALLKIPYKEIDLSTEYERAVVKEMLAAYESGMTPNPDVLCNRDIKFGPFAAWAFEQGAAYVATGHYARSESGRLYRGRDMAKDQSYFLHRLTSESLAKTLFPIGGMKKAAVREIAQRLLLPVAAKPDSQGLCFVGDVTLAEFLVRYITLKTGDVLNEQGEKVGEHDGSALYTRGQRHGFRLMHASQDEVPRFVVSTDAVANTVTVSKDRSAAFARVAHLKKAHWIRGEMSATRNLFAQARYREEAVKVEVHSDLHETRVEFSEPRLLSPGQSLVFYDGDECLGGGDIAAAA